MRPGPRGRRPLPRSLAPIGTNDLQGTGGMVQAVHADAAQQEGGEAATPAAADDQQIDPLSRVEPVSYTHLTLPTTPYV